MLSSSVLIVGAGPAGLMLACLLTKYQVPFIIIDKKAMISDQIKACMLSSRSLEIFSELDLLNRALSLGQLTTAFEIYPEKKPAISLRYDSVETRFPFNLHLGQPYTEKVLYDYLLDHDVDVFWQHELGDFTQDENGVVANIIYKNRRLTIQSAFLVGADGASSNVRKQCHFTFTGNVYPNHYLLGNVRLNWDLSHDAARLFFGNFGFLSVYPLPDGLMQIGGNIAAPSDRNKTPDCDELIALFDQRCIFPGKIDNLRWLSYYRTHCRHVKERVFNRVMVIGDAAQIISPLTGFGMNAGIQDAENLASKLAFIVKENGDKAILTSYQEERYLQSKKLSSFSNVLETVYTANDDDSKRLRDYMLSNLMESPESRQREAKRLMQV